MRLREITKNQLQEGMFDANTPEKIAAQAAQKLQALGYGQRKPLPPVQDSVAAVQKNPAQQQYIKGLVAQWQQSAPKAEPVVAPTGSNDTVAPFAGRSAPLPTVTVSGKLLTKGPDGLWHGEDGRAVTDPAQVAKIDKAYYTGMRNQKGTVKEAPQEYTTPSGIVVPGGARTDTTPSTANTEYRNAFVKWAGEKLRTVDPATRQTITLDQVNKTDIKDELDRAQDQVVATAGDPTKNVAAVNNYLTIAVAGVARVSQQLRQDSVYGSANQSKMSMSTGQAGQAIVTQQDIGNTLSQKIGMNASQIEALKKVAQDPASLRALLKLSGVQA